MDKCPNCGAKVYSSDKRCSKCGQELKKSSNISLIPILGIILIVAFFLVLASGFYTTQDTADMVVASEDDTSDDSQIESSSQDDSSSSDLVYWASTDSNKFHYSNCKWAQYIPSQNKIVYFSRQEAINDGKVPCQVCCP